MPLGVGVDVALFLLSLASPRPPPSLPLLLPADGPPFMMMYGMENVVLEQWQGRQEDVARKSKWRRS